MGYCMSRREHINALCESGWYICLPLAFKQTVSLREMMRRGIRSGYHKQQFLAFSCDIMPPLGFVTDKVALGQSPPHSFSSAHSITPATLHTHDIISGFDIVVKQTLLSSSLYWGFT